MMSCVEPSKLEICRELVGGPARLRLEGVLGDERPLD